MKYSVKLSAKTLVLASAFIFGPVGAVYADDRKDTMEIPPSGEEQGIGGRARAYDEWAEEQAEERDDDRRSSDYSRDSSHDRDRQDEKGTDGTGPKLEGRY